jgi:hypothetical protein
MPAIEKIERISNTITVHRSKLLGLHAAQAAIEIPAMFELPYISPRVFREDDGNKSGIGNYGLTFHLAETRPEIARMLHRSALKRLAAQVDVSTIGDLLFRASRKPTMRTYPLVSVGVHLNQPGTVFRPHWDVVEGISTSTALTPAVLRVHEDNHDVAEEVKLDPGDEVTIVSPVDPSEREIHSFVCFEGTSRASLVVKYKEPQPYEAMYSEGYTAPPIYEPRA